MPADPAAKFIGNESPLTIPQLAKLYAGVSGCARSTLEKRSARERWGDQRRDHIERVARQWQDQQVEKQASDITEAMQDYGRGRQIAKVGIGMAASLMNEAGKRDPGTGRLVHPNASRMMKDAVDLADKATSIIDRCVRGANEIRPKTGTQFEDMVAAADEAWRKARAEARAHLVPGDPAVAEG